MKNILLILILFSFGCKAQCVQVHIDWNAKKIDAIGNGIISSTPQFIYGTNICDLDSINYKWNPTAAHVTNKIWSDNDVSKTTVRLQSDSLNAAFKNILVRYTGKRYFQLSTLQKDTFNAVLLHLQGVLRRNGTIDNPNNYYK